MPLSVPKFLLLYQLNLDEPERRISWEIYLDIFEYENLISMTQSIKEEYGINTTIFTNEMFITKRQCTVNENNMLMISWDYYLVLTLVVLGSKLRSLAR